jgi:pimeloyl-ACP methyl ester carboxylesterase
VPDIDLSAGTIEYEDTGGSGPVVVLVPGLLMDSSEWRDVVADLAADHRCVVPTLPLGAHLHPMRPDADLSMRGLALLLGELLERLDLSDVTLAMNDWGGPQVLAAERPERLGRLVVTSCEAFDNVPPGLPGRAIGLAGRLPGGVRLAVLSLRVRALRRLPFTFGRMAKRPIPDEIFDRWIGRCLAQRAVRRDLEKYIRTTDYQELLRAADGLASFDRPALVAWAAEDRVMPPEHGRRLAELLPRGRLVEIPDSYTLIPLDQPVELARLMRQFIREPSRV